MPTFQLQSTVKHPVKVRGSGTSVQDRYTYQGPKGELVVFNAHPTKAWEWMIEIGGANAKMARAVVESFCAAGLARNATGQTFEDAIATLTIA